MKFLNYCLSSLQGHSRVSLVANRLTVLTYSSAFAKYIIMPLETKSLSAPIDFRIRLVQCYNTIMMRWSAYDWRSMRARRSGM